jgi:hypothetical protein
MPSASAFGKHGQKLPGKTRNQMEMKQASCQNSCQNQTLSKIPRTVGATGVRWDFELEPGAVFGL